MKILSVFLVFCALVFTNCQKSNNPEDADALAIKTAPQTVAKLGRIKRYWTMAMLAN